MSLIDLLSRRKEMQSQAGDLRSRFLSFHFVRLPCFWQPEALVLLSQEVNRLSRFRKRRDLIMKATGDTPRRMSTLGPSDIRQHSSLLPLLYEDQTLLSFLSCIAGEAFYLAPDKTEDLVCNYLHLENDTHGAHIDTFPFAFNTTLEAPDEGILL